MNNIQSTSLDDFFSDSARSQKEVLEALSTQPNSTDAEIAWMLDRQPITELRSGRSKCEN
jgi:hypothetical protein